MSAPFPLPDLVTIRNPADTANLYTNVPARVVPCMFQKWAVWNSATNTQVTYVSHWVDVEGPEDVVDQATLIAACHYGWEFDAAPIIMLEFSAWVLKLRIMWTEIRFTNTDNFYVRHYCSRVSLAGA